MSEHSFDDNPTALELRTLRAAVARFQEEAHASAVKLQRHSFDSARLHERAILLERENDQLKAELAVLRANPLDATNDSDARSQVQDMTLALRRLSQKLSYTEDALLSKTTELLHAQADTLKAKAAADGAYELGAKVRGREEASLARERHLEQKVAQLEEDARIVDIALKEYAALVREMEAAKSSPHMNGKAKTSEEVDEGTRISATLLEGKLTRSKLLAQFEAETAKIQAELHGARSELEVTKSLLEAERKGTAALVQELGNTKTALEKLHLEDGTAAKMVSRYMQFSQTSTNALLSKLSTLKARHAGTLSTLSSQNHSLIARLRASEAHGERLLSTLDELGGEIMKETWGRRREIGLRIRMGGREERIAEGLRRWVRKSDEMISRARKDDKENPVNGEDILDALLSMAQDARILLGSLDDGVLDEEVALSLSGSKARALLVDMYLDGLLDELRQERERRIVLEKRLAAVRDEYLLDGAILQEEHVRNNDDIENGDVQAVSLLAANFVDEAHDEPPAVPEKSPVLSPTPQPSQSHSYPEEPNQEGGPLDASGTDGAATSAMTRTFEIISFLPEVPQPTLPQSIINSSPSPIEPRDALDILDVPPKMDTPAPGLIPAISLSSADEDTNAGSKSNGPLETQDCLSKASTIVTIIEVSHTPGVPPSNPIINEESAVPSDLPQAAVKSTLVAESNGRLHDAPLATTTNNADELVEEVSLSVEFPFPATLTPVASTTSVPINSVPIPIPSPAPPISSPSPFTSSLNAVKPRSPIPLHPLLSDLIRVTKRYDDLQRAFRDCHIALESLKSGLKESSFSSADSLHRATIPTDILNAALRRLDDYTEDARVELEIRISDEALLAKGYEALLSVPGALTTAPSASQEANTHDDNEVPIQSDVERQVTEFVDGTDAAVRRARETFTRKLEDVQHDIAALKRAIHDPESFAPLGPPPSALSPSSSTSTLSSTSPSGSELSNHEAANAQSAGGWTSWIRNASRPASPAPPLHGPAPTFGNIMTAPRLRHSPSSGSMHTGNPQPPSARTRRPSFFGIGGGPSEPSPSPLAALELRVPMPNFAPAGAQPLTPGSASVFGGAYGILSPTSPLKPMTMPPGARVRTVSSTMYMLGLGAGSASGNSAGGRMVRSVSAAGGLGTPPSPLKGTSHGIVRASSSGLQVPVFPGTQDAGDDDDDMEEEDDTDVE